MSNLQNMFDEAVPQQFCTPSEHRRSTMNAHNKGVKRTDETRAKMSEAHKGRAKSNEHRAKLSEAHKGQVAWNRQAIMTPYGAFSSQAEAIKSLGLYYRIFKRHMTNDPTNWYYIKD